MPCTPTPSLAAIDQLALTVGSTLGTSTSFTERRLRRTAPFEQVTEHSFDRAFAINAKAVFFTVQRLAPLVVDGGSIVFTTSIADEGGSPGMIIYSGAKSAVLAIAKTFATELMSRAIG